MFDNSFSCSYNLHFSLPVLKYIVHCISGFIFSPFWKLFDTDSGLINYDMGRRSVCDSPCPTFLVEKIVSAIFDKFLLPFFSSEILI